MSCLGLSVSFCIRHVYIELKLKKGKLSDVFVRLSVKVFTDRFDGRSQLWLQSFRD